MSWSGLTDIRRQLTFYGAYHSNTTNIFVHILCVPMIMWSGQVMGVHVPLPSWFPYIHYKLSDHLEFELNASLIQAVLYMIYYAVLEPVAALLYAPQMALSVLTAIAFSKRQDHMSVGLAVHAFAWVAQFLGHGLAEHRAPALIDNILGAAVLAPFFVHLEILFYLGYRPALYKQLQSDVGKEIARISKIEVDKKREKQAKLQ